MPASDRQKYVPVLKTGGKALCYYKSLLHVTVLCIYFMAFDLLVSASPMWCISYTALQRTWKSKSTFSTAKVFENYMIL